MSAQTPARQAGGVVIRERVEVSRAAIGVPVAHRADDCAAPIVGEALFRGGRGWVSGTALDGTLTVTTSCGTSVSGPLASGFVLSSIWPYHHGGADRYNYEPLDTVVVVRVPLRATETLAHSIVDLSGAGLPLDLSGAGGEVRFGCGYVGYGPNTCVELSTYAHPGGIFTITRQVSGAATAHTHAWPDTVACGTTTPLPVTLTKADSTEGYVGPDSEQTFQLPGADPAVRGVLAYGGATGGVFYGVPYADTRAGAVAFVAPACDALTAPTPATLWVTGLPYGVLLDDTITVLPEPPVAFRVTAAPDTLALYATAYLSVAAVTASGGAASLPPETPVTVSASGHGVLSYQRRFSSNSVEGPTITIPYAGATGEAGSLTFTALGDVPEADTPVTLSAAGGGISGDTTVVVLGRLRLELDAAPDSVATGGESSLTAVLRGAGAATFDPAATLTFVLDSPSMGTLRWTSADTTRAPTSGTTLAGVPSAAAAAGEVAFVAVGRQAPPVIARGGLSGGGFARTDSTAADSVRAKALIRAFVESQPVLADTTTVTVAGRSGLVVTVICSPTGLDCTIQAALPDLTACGGSYPEVIVSASGGLGEMIYGLTRISLSGSTPTGTLTVPAQAIRDGLVRFVLDSTATGTEPLSVRVEFPSSVQDCSGNPILPGETTVEIDYDASRRKRLVLTISPTTIRMGGVADLGLRVLNASNQPVAVPEATPVSITVTPPDALTTWGRLRVSGTPLPFLGPYQWNDLGNVLNYEASGQRPTGDQQITFTVSLTVDGQTLSAQKTLLLEAPALAVRLLSQDNTALSESGALVLPSRFQTDLIFPATLGFADSRQTAELDPFRSSGSGDVYMLRPELVGAADSAAVTFRVLAGQTIAVYTSVEDPAGGAPTYRSTQAFRLVTNDTDDAYQPPCSPECPTPAPGDQTLKVALGNVLRVEALVDGIQVAFSEYQIGTGSDRSGVPYVPLEGILNWRWGTNAPNIELAEGRASEAWAQASVRFVNRNPPPGDPAWGAFSAGSIQNILEITLANGGTQLSESGTFTVAGIDYSYTAPLSLAGFVAGLRDTLQTRLGVPVTVHPNRAQSNRNNSDDDQSTNRFQDAGTAQGWHIVIGRARNIVIGGDTQITAPGVRGRRVVINVANMPLQDVASLVHAVRDDVPGTIDVVVVGAGSLYPLPRVGQGLDPSQPLAKGYDDAAIRYGLTNAIVADIRAVSSSDADVHVIAHELGHVLYGGGHANVLEGVAGVTPGNSRVRTHLMYGVTNGGRDRLEAPKRLSEGYSTFARQRGLGGLEPVLFPVPPSSPRPASDPPLSSLTPSRP